MHLLGGFRFLGFRVLLVVATLVDDKRPATLTLNPFLNHPVTVCIVYVVSS